MIGRKLAHYTITGKLGQGGMGVVYEAVDGHLDRSVALKLLPHDAVADTARKQRFVQEAKAASALNHPNIVTIYDIASADGIDYITMELIRGRTLEQMLSHGKLRLEDALKYGVQIADALAAAHAAGIIHRDLKPGNLMINDRGDVKVLDFGLAKLTDKGDISEEDGTRTERAVTEEGSVVGSAPYMSPEQAEGRKVDARSDIFSYGSVLYEMLTGKRAFRGVNSMAIMAAILKDEPEPPSQIIPDLPRELDRVLSRCLRKPLDRRSQSMAEIRLTLQELKEESTSGTLGSPLPTESARTPARWPYYVAGVVILVAAITALSYFHFRKTVSPLQAHLITSFVGAHDSPSLSPDGNQFAFAWDGDVPHGKQHVYISLVGKGTPLRLTPEDENSFNPSWSPDGQSIAFQRQTSKSGAAELMVMPALGGSARKVTQDSAWTASWSPDSKWLIWSQREDSGTNSISIRIALASGGEPRRLFSSPTSKGDFGPAISPNGRMLVFDRVFGDYDGELFLVDFNDGRSMGTPRQLTRDHRFKFNPLWSNDGKQIIYLAGESTSDMSMYRVPVSGGEPERIEGIGANATSLTIAARSNRLLYSTESVNYDIWRIDMNASGARKPERFLSSTRYEASPAYSPDGKRIAFESNREGVQQVWVANADGSNPVSLTSFKNGLIGGPKWSPDGLFIAFDARLGTGADIYTVSATGGPVKQLTDHPGQDHVPSWSPDGKWIYFGSRRSGGHEIFRMHPDGSGVQQITHHGGNFGVVAPDGKWLYYSVQGKGLWKMPPAGGDVIPVLPPEALYKVISFAMTTQGIYAVAKRKPEGYPVVFYPFQGGKPRTITILSQPLENFPAVSPDGRYFLYSTADDPRDEIMLVDNFH